MIDNLPLLIIGQGIAGSTLAFQLYFQNIPFFIIDDGHKQCASKVAAGLANPFTGPKMLLTWNAENLFPAALSFYRKVSVLVGEELFVERPIVRPFFNIAEQNEILSKASEHSEFLYKDKGSAVLNKDTIEKVINYGYEGLITAQSGFLKTEAYLSACKAFFSERYLDEDSFSFQEVKYFGKRNSGNKPYFEYQNRQYSGIVFANGLGMQAIDSPFSWLPYRPNFGEVMEIEWPEGPHHFIANRKVYAVSHNENIVFRVGATYKNSYPLSLEASQEGKDELKEHFEKLIKGGFTVKKYLTGLRPATKDRKPFVGEHLGISSVYCLGGFGAKGVSLAPWCSGQLVEKILNEGFEIDSAIDINRFQKEFLSHKNENQHTFSLENRLFE